MDTQASERRFGDKLFDWGLMVVIVIGVMFGLGMLALFASAAYVAIYPTYHGSRADAVGVLVIIVTGVTLGYWVIVRSAERSPKRQGGT